MDFEELQQYLLQKKATTEETPFGPDALVYKVLGKMYALVSWREDPLSINLKCEPILAMALRDQYEAVQPGYHMNKKHWNTVVLDGTIPQDEILEMIDHSYERVVKGLTKQQRQELASG